MALCMPPCFTRGGDVAYLALTCVILNHRCAFALVACLVGFVGAGYAYPVACVVVSRRLASPW